MESSNSPQALSIPICIFDSDVVINWLTIEENLWEAPHKIIQLIEEGKIEAYLNLLTLMEIRYVLRRKKLLDENTIKEDSDKITNLFKVTLLDEIHLITANNLQEENPLSPLDAVLIALGLATGKAILLSRDRDLLKVAKNFLSALTPEDFLAKIKV